MATNYIQPGDVMSLVAPSAVAAGEGMLVGALYAVALSAAANGAPVEGAVTGVFTLAKTDAQAWTLGQKIYWDNATKRCTTAAAAGANALIGVAAAAVAATAGLVTGKVRLGQVF